jgi:type II restriction/modification system DNA methylase subunit YeeA
MHSSAGKLVLTIPEFVNKWRNAKLNERAAAQSHFIDLCTVLDQQTPIDVDSEGTSYTFEKGVQKNTGGDGFADVWKRNYFAWEYKRKYEDLGKAYQQLLKYREALANPPLLVVCDLDRFDIHTNWTNTPPEVYLFDLNDLLANKATITCKVPPVDVLRFLFSDPERLKPGQTTAQITTQAAEEFSTLAEGLRKRNVPAERAAHFIMRLLFCLFSEDIGLLPDQLFTRLVQNNRRKPAEFTKKLRQLFAAMANEGGSFGPDDIPYFDGGLFMDDKAYELTVDELDILARAAELNWGGIEPAIFGTLFERILDPDKRSQIGAHYTSQEDIMLIVEPVLMEPLRREWEVVREKATSLLEDVKKRKGKTVQKELSRLLGDFVEKIASVRVLDPACGSGNFLYVSLKLLLDLEKQVSVFASSNQLSRFFVKCRPGQLHGIESNIYAHKVASVSVWIGFLQWQRDNGIIITDNPIMQPLENIRHTDAILSRSTKAQFVEPEWPEADVIVGNPPFLGGNKIRQQLGDDYVDGLFEVYKDRVPAFADLVCYWFERARVSLEKQKDLRVGLLATNSIRGGVNRKVLESIKKTGNIFWAQSDRDWILDGANVRVSMIAFDNGAEKDYVLDGIPVSTINADLSSQTDTTSAKPLTENENICFMGASPKGPFDIADEDAHRMLKAPVNVNGRPNRDVVRPVKSGIDLVSADRNMWTIDFGLREESEAAQYEVPFEHIKKYVYPIRSNNRRAVYAEKWWLYAEPRPGMRRALKPLKRYIATPAVSKHRIIVWVPSSVLCNQGVLIFARDDDYFFGVLQSRVHDVWALKQGTSLEDRPRYTPTSTFETFPFPWAPNLEPKDDLLKQRIGTAAKELVRKREAWLNPPDALEGLLRGRTLTNLYNANPRWLQDAHTALDNAVLAAYGWASILTDDEILARLLQLNSERFAKQMERTDVISQSEESEPKPKKPLSVGTATSKKKIPISH